MPATSSGGAVGPEAWNFGPKDEDAKPVSWIVESLTSLWGKDACWKLDGRSHPHEDTYLKLDCSKARSALQWKPKISIDTALEWIVEFAKVYFDGGSIGEVVQSQIRRYQAL